MKRRYDIEKWVFDNPVKFYGGQIVIISLLIWQFYYGI
jgi:hypothetical protein